MELLLLRVIALMVLAGATTVAASAADCANTEPRQNKRYVTTDVNLRPSPSLYGDPLTTLPMGQVVYAFSQYQEWSRVNVAKMNIVGYVATRYLTENCIEGEEHTRKNLSRAQVVQILMAESQSRYSGSCPCPYYSDRAGRRCGGRSAYSRPGGASPLCYASDVSPGLIDAFLSDR
ncbi:MAG: SH3 domain-containing protein [Pseudomonadota bacterium]